MKINVFINFSLVLTLALTALYGQLKQHYNRVDDYQREIAYLKNRVQSERFKHLLTSYEFMDFRQYVATLLPGVIKEQGPGEKSYPARTLASVVQKPSHEYVRVKTANQLFEQGKRFHREKNFAKSVEVFDRLVREHPYSAYLPVAMFLLADAHLELRNNTECVAVAEKMLELYPESELTGHALLRAGKVYEFQERHDEAIDIYKTILKVFPSDARLRDSASIALRAIEL